MWFVEILYRSWLCASDETLRYIGNYIALIQKIPKQKEPVILVGKLYYMAQRAIQLSDGASVNWRSVQKDISEIAQGPPGCYVINKSKQTKSKHFNSQVYFPSINANVKQLSKYSAWNLL